MADLPAIPGPDGLPTGDPSALARIGLPNDLETLSDWLIRAHCLHRTGRTLVARIVAKIRDDYFPRRCDSKAFRRFIEQHFERHDTWALNTERVGRMLNECVDMPSRSVLFDVGPSKLDEIVRLYDHPTLGEHFDAWLSRVDITAFSRDELRRKVRWYIEGKEEDTSKQAPPPKPAPEPPKPPVSISAALDVICSMTEDDYEDIARAPGRTPLKILITGATLFDSALHDLEESNQLTPEHYAAMVGDLEGLLVRTKALAAECTPVMSDVSGAGNLLDHLLTEPG
ncbi:MAG: hypothetical protein HN976_41660 [Lentisphaerae bacterium]|nr:hypothetical protein [Lentisphaerota bacterium]